MKFQVLTRNDPDARAAAGRARRSAGRGRTRDGRAALWALTFALSTACATAPPVDEIPSAETYYQRGLEVLEGESVLLFFSDVDYPKAIELFQEVIDNYPYSEYATLAELKIADTYFDQEKYDEAASYYQDFVELHPSNPRVDYALYRHGLCSFRRLRDPDRDQTPTRDAIAQFQVLLERYPDSEYAPPARDMIAQSEDLLAEHDVDVGDYYMEREHCYAASRRYEQALVSYPRHSSRLDTMLRMARALRCLQQYEEAVSLYQQILDEGADGEVASRARDDLDDLGIRTNGGPAD